MNTEINQSIISYLKDPLPIDDLSYSKYISKNEDLLYLCSPQLISKGNCEDIFKYHDIQCEFSLLNYLTVDQNNESKCIKLPENELLKLNRYPNIIPNKYNAVPINKDKEKGTSNYINASLIKGVLDTSFICAQNPLKNTIDSFWLMIINHNIKLDIQLSYSMDEGNDKYVPYWPKDSNSSIIVKDKDTDIVYEIKEDAKPISVIEKYFVYRYFKVYNIIEKKEILSIQQIHFNGWEDHSIPPSHLSNVFFDEIISQIETTKNDNGTILVHCSDGSGRTGTLLAIYNTIISLSAQKKDKIDSPVFCIFNVVRKLREERSGMVSDISQYQFIYDYVRKYVKDYFINI